VIEQGDIWQVTAIGQISAVLVVQASYITEADPAGDILCVHLDHPDRLPETVLSARVGAYLADIRTLAALRHECFREHTGRANADELEHVKVALRTLFDLGL
jgi:mRNA-degrading endonuclease toxin of MazEF toxin-antitoxin module